MPNQSSRARREKFDIGIDMKEAHIWVLNKQEEIARAKRAGDLVLAETLGLELVNSIYGRAVAVQIVVNNQGARSPGLSKQGFKTNDDYRSMIEQLEFITNYPEQYSSTPLDRIYIPKKDGSLRPLSIPSYTDRCLQALFKLALEPISEEFADLSSYGFRPIRSVSWAVARTLNGLANPLAKYGFVVEVDIMGCFDNINHDFVSQITPVVPKKILWEWLKCGYVERDDETVHETNVGVPQGGILSPLLTNITLDGLELHISRKILEAKTGSQGSLFCRYADDMVLYTTTRRNAEIGLEAIKEFLNIRGLQVKAAKTRIIDVHESSFEFLGFEFSLVHRHNKKRQVARVGIPLSALRKVRQKINKIFRSKLELHNMIDKINELIRGWGYAYRFAHTSIYVYRSLRYWIWKQYYAKCYKLTSHRFDKANHTTIHEYVMSRYFAPFETYTTWPSIHDHSGFRHVLFDISSISYTPPLFTNKARNAFILEDREILDSYSLRSKTRFNQIVMERWFGCCGLCRKRLDINFVPYELHHILPKRFAGKDVPSNLVPLCKSPCHNMVSSAIQTRNLEKILEFIRLGILELPVDYLNQLTPPTD